MVITVTMNPAIDRMVFMDRLVYGKVNRVALSRVYAGGKGVNVSRIVRLLGGETLATGVVAGDNGCTLCSMLRRDGISSAMYSLGEEAQTRVNVKIYAADGETTDINEPGPMMTAEQCAGFMRQYEELLHADDVVVLSGSLCRGLPDDFYAHLATIGRQRGCRVMADVGGEALRHVLDAQPQILKPNQAELEQMLGRELRTLEEVCTAAAALLEMGAHKAVVSMGEQGAFLITPQRALYAPPVKVSVRGTVGAGDSMVAGLAFAMERGLDDEHSLALACACATACVAQGGTGELSAQALKHYAAQVRVQEWK